MSDWASRVLDEVAAAEHGAVARLAELVRVPSVDGTDAEHEIQAMLATELGGHGLEVDHWRLPLDELLAEPDFPGVEVERSEAWGLVGRLPGRGDGADLMLNGHVDVVPTGDLSAWTRPDPFSGLVVDGELHGRGACDMKAGLVAANDKRRGKKIEPDPERSGRPRRGSERDQTRHARTGYLRFAPTPTGSDKALVTSEG
jgi:acetylornithine deacetylase